MYKNKNNVEKNNTTPTIEKNSNSSIKSPLTFSKLLTIKGNNIQS